MVLPESVTPSDQLREQLRGFPEPTIQACAQYQATRDPASFERALVGVLEHHLPRPAPQPLATLPGSTTLVQDLGLDSLTMAELTFLFEELFGAKVPHEELVKIVTLDDLRSLLRRHLPPSPAA